MGQEKFKDDMTISELARMTNRAFIDLETRMQTGFQELRRDIHGEIKIIIHETEERLLGGINGIEVHKPEFDALKNDVNDLADRVGILEKKSK